MADVSEHLVKLITRQVEAALKGKPRVGEPSSAIIHPPIGVCTGDYSKFEELKGKAVGATGGPSASATDIGGQAVSGTQPMASPLPLKGVVTAKQLEHLAGGVVYLAPEARLSPLAVDYVKARKLRVERINTSNPGKTTPTPANSESWVWWCDGHEPQVERLADQLRPQLKPLSYQRSSGAMGSVLKQLARRVRGGEAAGGVLFVDTAGRAACLANRSPVLRAVVGTSDHAVDEALAIGANVLILEHPQHGWRAMRQMVEKFIGSPRANCPEVERQIRELSE